MLGRLIKTFDSPMLNFAANLSWMFQEWPFLDRFSAAADTGFKAVEYLFPYEFKADDIARQLSRNKLSQVLFNLPPGDLTKGERGVACLAARQDEFRSFVLAALEYARASGTPRLHLMSGIVAQDRDGALAVFRDSIRFACEAAAVHGIDILIEPINNRDVPGYLMNSFDLAAHLIDDLELPNLRLLFDVYHRQVIHGDVTRGLETFMPITGHIQISSAPLRQEPTTGELDDRYILRTIERLGYRGHIGCEYQPTAGTLEGLGWMKRL